MDGKFEGMKCKQNEDGDITRSEGTTVNSRHDERICVWTIGRRIVKLDFDQDESNIGVKR